VEFFGTKFTLTLGGWRLRFALALEDADAITDATRMPLQHESVSNRGT
jgi:hypothetical protein